LADDGHFAISAPPPNVVHNGHIFFVLAHDKSARQSLEAHLASRNIRTTTHYVPLHSSPAGMRYGRTHGAMTQSDRAADCLLRLPVYSDLGADQERVIEAVQDWSRNRKAQAA
jgi:dTDP-4-amino-4,6-dideoxygalactose transaminase